MSEEDRDFLHPYPGVSPGFNPGVGMIGGAPVEEGFQARAGSSLEGDVTHADQEAVVGALKSVHDPEIPVNIHDLGLIYTCDMDDKGDVAVTMTLTAPACPVAGEMPVQVAEAVAALDGVGEVVVTLTWTPPWRPDMMSEDAQMALDFY